MTRLQWHEPAACRRAILRDLQKKSPWRSAIVVCGVFFMLLALRGLVELGHLAGTQNPNRPSWLASVTIAAAVAVLAYFLPILFAFLPNSIVILSDKGINNNVIGGVVRIRFWPWEQIAHCSTGEVSVGTKCYRTLALHDAHGKVLATFGLRDRPTIEEIRDGLNQQQKALRTGAR